MLFFLSLFTFGAGFLITYDHAKEDNVKRDHENARQSVHPQRFQQKRRLRSDGSKRKTLSKEDDLSTFITILRGKISSEDCEKLFNDIFISRGNPAEDLLLERKLYLLLEKWGQISPRHALDKIKKYGNYAGLNFRIFKGWAEKNPEAVAAFFDETQDPFLKNKSGILLALSGKWASQDPVKAWDWLQAREKTIPFKHQLRSCKVMIIRRMVDRFPAQIPQFISKLEASDLQENAYVLGEKWGEYKKNSSEWLDNLPRDIQIKAQAGRIMGETKENFKDIDQKLASFDQEQQQEILNELAFSLLDSSCMDTPDRLNWLMERLPEESISSDLRFHIKKWTEEDKDAKPWIDSLPDGKKKEYLLNIYKK